MAIRALQVMGCFCLLLPAKAFLQRQLEATETPLESSVASIPPDSPALLDTPVSTVSPTDSEDAETVLSGAGSLLSVPLDIINDSNPIKALKDPLGNPLDDLLGSNPLGALGNPFGPGLKIKINLGDPTNITEPLGQLIPSSPLGTPDLAEIAANLAVDIGGTDGSSLGAYLGKALGGGENLDLANLDGLSEELNSLLGGPLGTINPLKEEACSFTPLEASCFIVEYAAFVGRTWGSEDFDRQKATTIVEQYLNTSPLKMTVGGFMCKTAEVAMPLFAGEEPITPEMIEDFFVRTGGICKGGALE